MSRWVNIGTLGRNALVAVLAFFPSIAVATEKRPATLTTPELRQRLRDAATLVRAWYVEYESSRRRPTGELSPRYVHRFVAAKAPDRFFHWSTKGYSWADWREDPYQQRVTLTPTMAVVERPAHRQFRMLSVAPDAPLPGSMPGEFLFLALGWWSFPQRPPPLLANGAPCVLSAVASSPKYVASPQQELVAGSWCDILEYPGHDRLWLDCSRGCALLAREVFDRGTKSLRQRIEAKEHREVEPGIWVPFALRNMIFNVDHSDSQGGKLVKTLDSTVHMLEVRLNEQVLDDVFRFEPLPGSIESVDDKSKQVVPGGTEFLDEMVNWTQRHFHFPGIPARDTGSATEAVLEYAILGGGVAALILLLFSRRRHLRIMSGKVVPENVLTVSKENRA
jgi:hypothetical protein